MTSTTSGAVFFLGTRAHYQTLQPPDTANYDAENGNTCEYTDSSRPELAECGWIHCARTERSGSDMLLLEYHCEEPTAQNTGVTRRFRGRRAQDGSSERILGEDNIDMDPAGIHNLSYRESIKSKESAASGRCASLRALLSNLKARRRRKPSEERSPAHIACTYRDSCRCLDCQSRYFECDDSDSDYSVSSGNYNDYDYNDHDYNEFDFDYNDRPATPVVVVDDAQQSTSRDADNSSYDENEEVFIDSPPDNISTDLLIKDEDKPKEKMSVSSEETTASGEQDFENPLDGLEMAAGTPVVLDYLLNHPIACCVQ